MYSKDAKGAGFRRVIVRHSDSTLISADRWCSCYFFRVASISAFNDL
jgi:hypothetical protein